MTTQYVAWFHPGSLSEFLVILARSRDEALEVAKQAGEVSRLQSMPTMPKRAANDLPTAKMRQNYKARENV